MLKLISGFQGKSQFDPDIEEAHRRSACGPVTAFLMIGHLAGTCPLPVSDLYRRIGGTRIGLPVRRFIKGIQAVLGNRWKAERCSLGVLKEEIDADRPVAAKFDKWFSFRWFGKFAFDYHWVPVVGYEDVPGDTILAVHDNGGPNRPSRIRHISYHENRSVLTFVRVSPAKKRN
ncbi:hypothetical protein [Bhargavaea cecembensis]|uniref:hypothetical protein n=1 Tax=Bhargavaea cecembensis TaxID=394098 RepID=UPI00058DFEF4|nr:hypothetical protein [Bhargavaea cecembensis]